MPVPDEVIFGPDLENRAITYGDVRALAGDERFVALKRRMDTFLVNQIDELANVQGESRKVYAPFPLFLLTCVAIETLGKALYQPAQHTDDEDGQREGFLTVCNKCGQRFSQQLAKEDKVAYDALWGENEHKKVKSISHIIYRFGRHTMVHGFRGKGVYLTESCAEWLFQDGAVIVNPYWFWIKYKNTYERTWTKLFENKEITNPLRKSAEAFLSELLE